MKITIELDSLEELKQLQCITNKKEKTKKEDGEVYPTIEGEVYPSLVDIGD